MPEIFADEGQLLYLPFNEEPTKPYWKAFMAMAVTTQTMEINEADANMIAFFDDHEQIVGIQTPEPIDDSGAPVEDVINFLEAFLENEDVTDIVDHVREIKGSFLDFENQEFMEIIKEIA